jgi:dTDP-4-amino-4,6-dideoxygalactose transaminase
MKEIPFFKHSIDTAEINQVGEVLDQKGSLKALMLEENFKKYIGCKYAVSTSSGTAAMHSAMCALDLKRGDKIVCSVNSFPSIAEVVRHFDAEPIFVDIDKDDFNIDPEKLDQTLTKHKHKKLKGVFLTHVAGQPADLDAIYDLTKKHGVKVIEDASHALGATYNGKKIGFTGADITTFSFSPQMSNSIVNGGILATENEELNNRAKLLRNHAIVSKGWDKYGNLDYVYDVIDIGCKYDISELDAAFAIAQLEKTEIFIQKRVNIAKIYDRELADVPHISLPVKKREHNYNLYIIKIDKNRDSFARELKNRGIYTGLHFIPLHLLSYYKNKYSLRVNDFPVALTNYQQILSLPIYPSLKESDVMYICKQIKEIAKTRV